MTILDRNSGVFSNTNTFSVSRSSGSFGTGTTIVVAVFGDTTVTTPGSGASRVTPSVVNLGLYSYDIVGAGQASVVFSCATGSGQWWAWELSAGSTWLSGIATQNNSAPLSFTTGSLTPPAGAVHLLAVTGGVNPSTARSVTSYNNSFALFGSQQATTLDWPFSGGADLNVTANGSTAYSTTGTFSGIANTAAGGILLSYVNASAGSAFTRTADDTLGLTDAAASASVLSRAPSDTADLTDSTSAAAVFARTQADVAGMVDAVSAAVAFAQAPADTAGLTDQVVTAAAYARTGADSSGLTDAVSQLFGFGYVRAADDTLGMTDSATPVLTSGSTSFTRSADDAVGLTDAVVVVGAFTRASDDSTGLADSTTAASGLARAVADLTGLADAVSSGSAFARLQADDTGLTDAVTALLAGAGTRQVDDSLGLTDAVTYSSTQTLADSLGLVDALVLVVAAGRAAADALGLSDSVTAVLSRSVTVSDSIGLTDAADAVASIGNAHVRTVADSLGLTSWHQLRQTIHRPYAGTITRPYAGVISRYPLVSD